MELQKKTRSYSQMFQKQCKYIFVCGGTISGVGKGVITSSIGLLLKKANFVVSVIKIDPYFNVDAGLLNPYEHGEVFVLDDGSEVDLDLGNYERFLDINLTYDHNITSGKIYQNVLSKERQGIYEGKTVQVIPHVKQNIQPIKINLLQITNEIKKWIEKTSQFKVDKSQDVPDVVLVEIGGVVGDIEGEAYFESIRQIIMNKGKINCLIILVTYLPQITNGEQKTKPIQNSIKELRNVGLFADIIICRSSCIMREESKKKVALFSSLSSDCIINVPDVNNLFSVPILLNEQNILQKILKIFEINEKQKVELNFLQEYISFSESLLKQKEITICIVGKYIDNNDSYLSLTKALQYSSVEAQINLKIQWIAGEELEKETEKSKQEWEKIQNCDGLLVPGGFGERGAQGKINSIKYARENKKPFLGICFGFQLAVIEFARNVLGMENATSEEFLSLDLDQRNEQRKKSRTIIKFIPESSLQILGGTMRKGIKETQLINNNSIAFKLYGKDTIKERHRHRYEVNPKYIQQLENNGLFFTGVCKNQSEGKRMIIFELPKEKHPFFFGVQFHPEFLSRFEKPSPTILGFLLACSHQLYNRLKKDGSILKLHRPWLKNQKNPQKMNDQNQEINQKNLIIENLKSQICQQDNGLEDKLETIINKNLVTNNENKANNEHQQNAQKKVKKNEIQNNGLQNGSSSNKNNFQQSQ